VKALIFSSVLINGMHERGPIMDNKALDVNQLITAVGAVSEMAALMRDHLMANGFTRKEAVSIAGQYVCTLCSKQS
jgi:hypothetical protein